MKKFVIGIVVLVLVIGGGLAWQVFFTPGGAKNIPGLAPAVQVNTSAKAKPMSLTGIGGYKLEKVNLEGEEVPLLRIPVVTWGGYAALFAANGGGTKPTKDSAFYRAGKFAVEIVSEENPVKQLQGFAAGNFPVIWSTMDTLPLIYDALRTDKRVIPQVFGVFDWSFGGDGIIVRGDIKTPKDLKGKRIVVAGNTPSNFFLLWLLAQSGLVPSEVNIQYTDDAIQAKDAFLSDKKLDACVTWSPFLYEITDPNAATYVDGTRLLITSKDANQLIADVYLTRLDFQKDHPEIIQGFSQAMMEGWDLFQKDKQKVFNAMAGLFKLQGGANEASLMLGDVHLANLPENLMFFDTENPINAYKIFYLSQEYYKGTGSLAADASYEAEITINTAYLNKLKGKGLFASQTNQIKNSFNKQGSFNIADLETKKTVLSEDVQIYFDPQKVDFDFNSAAEDIAKNKGYLKKIAEQMEVLGTTIVKLVGHLDTTKVEEFKSQGPQVFIEASAQAKLISKKRAEYIKKLLVEKYGADAQRIITEGKGWDQPLDAVDQGKNRRVEIKFFSFE